MGIFICDEIPVFDLVIFRLTNDRKQDKSPAFSFSVGGCPVRSSNPAPSAERDGAWVRICHSEIGKLVCQAKSEQIFAPAKFPYAPRKTHPHTAFPVRFCVAYHRLGFTAWKQYTRLDLLATRDIASRKTVINCFSLALIQKSR